MTTDDLLQLATKHHRAGELHDARRLYQLVLAETPGHPAALFQIGLLELGAGSPEAALTPIRQAAQACPGEARYQFGLGKVLAALRRWPEAAAGYRLALQAAPQWGEAYFELGIALQSQGDFAGAVDGYSAAAEFQPESADTFNNLGICHQSLGDLPKAETAYRRAMTLRPGYAGAMSNLGTVLQETGRVDEAIDLFRSAAGLEPEAAAHAVNLGAALCRRRDFAEAASVLHRVVERDANNAEAAYNLANSLHGLGRPLDAAEQYRRATALRPDYVDASINLGNVYKELGEFTLATAAYDAALRARPDSVAALNNASCLLRTLGRLEEAEKILRRGLALNAVYPSGGIDKLTGNALGNIRSGSVLYNNLGNVLKDSGELDEAIDCFRRALELDPDDVAAHSNLCYSLSFQTPESRPILDQCQLFNARHAEPLQVKVWHGAGGPSPGRRLRIGYVSADFRDHCQSLFTIPLLSHHDHAAFEIFCYSSVERPDDYTRRIAGYVDVRRDVRPLDDAALCDVIRADGIDILVDLTMHMANGRPLVFARKPAPVQIAWLAYPGTTGIDAMDYRLSDPRLDPVGFNDHYTERTVRLPDSFWCYDPLADGPEVNALPAVERGYLTLGCLNNPCKLTDHTIRLWAAVMRQLPTAQLLLMSPLGPHRQRVLRRLAAETISAERVSFVPYRPRADYLRAYHDIDLGLDTFPYNGHTTSLDSLWMGVPLVTRVGRTCVGRGGLSQLFQLDLLELAAETDEAFVTAAVALGKDLPRLADLRRQLRGRLEHSPLMDAGRFAKNIEVAYLWAWSAQGNNE